MTINTIPTTKKSMNIDETNSDKKTLRITTSCYYKKKKAFRGALAFSSCSNPGIFVAEMMSMMTKK